MGKWGPTGSCRWRRRPASSSRSARGCFARLVESWPATSRIHGTGYSSLHRLRVLPFDELKIDKSFVDAMIDDEHATVVAAILALGHGLGRSVVAEGVETRDQLASLVRLGCDAVQGWVCSRALPPAELKELLAFPAPYAGLVSVEPRQAADDPEQVMAAVERAVRSDSSTDLLLPPVLEELTRVTGLESAYVTAVVPDSGEHEVVASYTTSDLDVREGGSIPWVNTLCHRALTVGPRASSDAVRDYPSNEMVSALGIRSYVMVPVTTEQGRLVGTLCAISRSSRTVDDRALRLMKMFSRLIAEAIDARRASGRRGLRVVVVDDSRLVRRMVRRVLDVGPGIEIVGEAATVEEAVRVCGTEQPDVIVLDLHLGEADGLAVLPAVLESCPDARVVVLSAGASERREAALAAGAAAVVDKRDGMHDLLDVVRGVV